MKKLIFVSGTMGVGKTTITREVAKRLENTAFLDGDWCWMLNPFTVNQENKEMVLRNIHYLLNSYLANSSLEYIFFCWVMDEQQIIEDILNKLNLKDVAFYSISLVCSNLQLEKNIRRDIKEGIRKEEDIYRAQERLKKYAKIDSLKIDTTNKEIQELVAEIIQSID